MTTSSWLVVPLLALLGLVKVAYAADDNVGPTVRGVMEENLRAYDAEDTGAVLRTMHTRSPEYETTSAALADQFREQDVTVTLVDFRYMGHDDEFAVARVRTKVVGPPGSGFQDNVTDNLVLFHQEGGVWKLWSDEMLGVQFSGG
jgi:hypothetical protein